MAQATAASEKESRASRRFEKIQAIVEQYGAAESALIPILQKVQEEYRYLPEEILTFVATALNLPPATVYGVATFYAQFSLEPKGKYIVRVCDGTACHVRKNQTLISTVKEWLGLKEGQSTTEDMRYTLEIVSCIGACALAPAVVINGKVHGQMTPEKVTKALEELEAAEKAEDK
ncbi:MAG TPA: NADH-quinone oxidoreductase subunit NuoE [Armatimonadota bacterium]|nr:NADH-quinone oxidoreductase subunit NuoE [Armatimonadota bacterium]HOP81055.1 NADH-quinone oxidoreductase subunit NuoE [Armatimonadota bacterium]HPP74604.1 NADH-quinone oxidoreductase subunit NuoE [Armatimonadota bacterium]